MASSQEHHHGPLSGAEDWDDLYRGEGQNRWSGRPNPALVAEASGLRPGNAIDLGCGEGADAIWLASQGWHTTGVDISAVALERARQAADSAGLAVDWVCRDFVADPPAKGAFDLVTTHYPALLRASTAESIGAVLQGVAPGGTLLFVTHALTDPDVARAHGFEPDDYLDTSDVIAFLGEDWTVEVDETRGRDPGQSPHSEDRVLRAMRRL